MTSIHPKLALAFDAYVHGLRRAPSSTLKAEGDNFGRAMLEAFKSRVPPDDIELVDNCATIRNNGIRAIRQGRLAEAEAEFRECHTILDTAVWLKPESRMLALTFLRAAEAYLLYRNGKLDQARALVHEAIRIDTILEKLHGYAMEIHRIQLACNFMRLVAYSRSDNAVNFGIGVLNVLEGDAASLPVPEATDPIDLANVPTDLLGLMANQIVGEMALVLAGADGEQAQRLFVDATDHVTRRGTGNCLRYTYAHDWLALKQAFLDKDVDRFLMRAAQLLADGRRDDSTLWFATALDLLILCNEFHVAGSDIVLERLSNDARNWEHIPTRLREAIRSLH